MPHPRPRDPRVRRAFLRFATEYLKEQARLERAQDRLRARRDNMVRQANRAGLSHDEIGEALQLSRQRVSQILDG